MPIPEFQSLMLPLLKKCEDKNEYTNQQAIEALGRQFQLSDDELAAMLPTGQQTVFTNRVAWARSYLRMAGLLENKRRGVFQITDRGLMTLSDNPPRIDIKYLMRFPEFAQTRVRKSNNETSIADIDAIEKTPEEQLEDSYQNLRNNLADSLLQQLKNCSPAFFERVVVEVLVEMGYGGSRKDAGEAIGRSGDGGIDGIIKEDKLGLDIIYIQAKKWNSSIGRPEIQKFAGALQGQRARKGVFITTSTFTKDAIDYAAFIDSKIVLIDGERFCDLMMDHNVGVSQSAIYEIKKIDADYFAEE